MNEKSFQECAKKSADNLVWMNSEEAATYLRVSVKALRTQVYRGHIPFYKLQGRLRFKRADLDRMLENTRCGSFAN
ncbi:MAG: helix-turn-helix domain-containing protein [Oligoflexia bacterium]|nr:helix-turn-helix domain-containing protein [Oligoflexia bacterium]